MRKGRRVCAEAFRRAEEARLFGGPLDELLEKLRHSGREGERLAKIFEIRESPPKARIPKLKPLLSRLSHPLTLGTVYLELGVAYLLLGQALVAEPLLRKAEELLSRADFEAKRLIAKYNLLLSYIYLGKIISKEEVEELVRELEALSPNPCAYFHKFVLRAKYTLAWLLFYSYGDPARALRVLADPGYEHHPVEREEASLLRAIIKLWTGRLTEEELERLVRDSFRRKCFLAVLRAMRGEQAARELVPIGRGEAERREESLTRAFVHYFLGDFSEAVDWAKKACEEYPDVLKFESACVGMISSIRARRAELFEFAEIYRRWKGTFYPPFEREYLKKLEEVLFPDEFETKLYLLGKFRVEHRGASKTFVFSRPVQLLVYLLLAEGSWVSREELADMLFGEPGKVGSLRVVVKRARDAFEPFGIRIESAKGCYRLNAGALWVDVFRFLELSRREDTKSLLEAVELYRGEPLEGVREDPFVDALRRRVRERLRAALRKLSEALDPKEYLKLLEELKGRAGGLEVELEYVRALKGAGLEAEAAVALRRLRARARGKFKRELGEIEAEL